jgi:HPt (histidine-containing phosphotransfer) domain-containing protein
MDIELNNLPAIDWELGKQLAGGKQNLAEDLLTLLLKNLKTDLAEINQHYLDKNYAALTSCVHKLHGAVSYCGTPRLKTLLLHLETQLKIHIMVDLPSLLNQLNAEVNLLLEAPLPPPIA